MKLDIIVPHYREPWELCKFLFDTIGTQRNVPWENIRVLVINDGDDLVFPDGTFDGYPYRVDYIVKENGGVSAARNYGMDHSDADYIMFCDIDDGFLNNYGLHLVFSAMNEGADFIYSNFIEEVKDTDGSIKITSHDNDLTFVHGKAYRRQFLVDWNLRFEPTLTKHEDGAFNALVYAVAKHEGKEKTITTPFYLWRWNDNSVVRSRREDFVLDTYNDCIRGRELICAGLKERGYEEDFEIAVVMTVANTYYDFQKARYHLPQNEKRKRNGEKAFKRFLTKYEKVLNNCSNKMVGEIIRAARENAYQNGMLIERMDLRSWLRHIDEEVKA